ncbi:MAG: VOC family protein [Draconibacterium sp.]|nr:VOC family protein [Draconibacterium sp.]
MSTKQKKFPLPDVAQICILVPDIDEAVKTYWERFGVGPWHHYTYGKPLVKRMTRHGKPYEYKMKVALSHIGNMRIELIEPLEGDTVYTEFIEEHGYGVHHLGFLTNDMQASLKDAEECGIAMTQDGAGFGPDDDGHYAYLDTEKLLGTTVELIERPKRRNPPEKIYPKE